MVGLVVPDIRNSFYYTIVHALSKCLEQEGYQVIVFGHREGQACLLPVEAF